MQLLVTMGVGGGLVYLLRKILTLRWPFITVLFITMTVILMYRLKHCRECYMKNKARGNEVEMANIARGAILASRPSALFFV